MTFLTIAPEYTLKDREHPIRCPTFSGYCEMTGRSTYHDRVFSWLDTVLG